MDDLQVEKPAVVFLDPCDHLNTESVAWCEGKVAGRCAARRRLHSSSHWHQHCRCRYAPPGFLSERIAHQVQRQELGCIAEGLPNVFVKLVCGEIKGHQ